VAISRQRRKELRREALSIIWQTLDAKTHDPGLVEHGSSDEEIEFIAGVLDKKAQRAYNECRDYEDKCAKDF